MLADTNTQEYWPKKGEHIKMRRAGPLCKANLTEKPHWDHIERVTNLPSTEWNVRVKAPTISIGTFCSRNRVDLFPNSINHRCVRLTNGDLPFGLANVWVKRWIFLWLFESFSKRHPFRKGSSRKRWVWGRTMVADCWLSSAERCRLSLFFYGQSAFAGWMRWLHNFFGPSLATCVSTS